MLKNDKVLIVITCFNHEKFVAKTIQSVLNQTHKNLEIVVIDNGSSDNSKAIIQNLALEFLFIKTVLNRENVGICKAVNNAAASSSADYIIDLAADDLLKSTYCEECIKAFETLDDSYGCVITRVEDIDENDIVIFQHGLNKSKSADFDQILLGNYSTLIGHFYKLNYFKELGLYDENLVFEDRDFHLRFAQKYKYHFIDNFLFGYRFLPQSLSKGFQTKQKMMDSYLQILLKLEKNLKNPEHLKLVGKYAGNVAIRVFLMEKFEVYPKVFEILNKYEKPKSIHLIFLFLSQYKVRNFGFFNFIWKLNRSRKHLIYKIQHGNRNFNDFSK